MTVMATEAKVSNTGLQFLFCFVRFSFQMTTRSFYMITFRQITTWLLYSRALKNQVRDTAQTTVTPKAQSPQSQSKVTRY